MVRLLAVMLVSVTIVIAASNSGPMSASLLGTSPRIPNYNAPPPGPDIKGSVKTTDAPTALDWATYDHDSLHSGIIPVCPASALSYVWTYTTNSGYGNWRGSPVESDGIVVMPTTNGVLHGVTATTGGVVWTAALGTAGYWTGSPVIWQDRVACFFVSGGGSTYTIGCVRLSNGGILWQTAVSAHICIDSDPIVMMVGGVPIMYIGAWDGYVLGLNMNTGAIVYQWSAGDAVWGAIATDGTDLYVPVVGTGIKKYTTAGTLLWTMSPTTTGCYGGATYYNGRVFVADNSGNLICVNPSTGLRNWTCAGVGAVDVSIQSVDAAYVYIGTQNSTVDCVRQSDGGIVWSTPMGQVIDGSIAVTPYAGGRLYVSGASPTGALFAMDRASGAILQNIVHPSSLWELNSVARMRNWVFVKDGSENLLGYQLTDTLPLVPINNVGCTKIMTPLGFLDGTVDSGQVVTPACSVYNYGNVTQPSYTVRLKIATPTPINVTATVTSHAPGARLYVTFPSWTAGPRGTYAVSCSTELTGDIQPSNDKQTGSVTVIVRDVGVTAMTAPTGTIDSGPPIQPQATVYNYGTQAATFNVTFTITGGYSNTQTVTSLAPATGLNVTFAGWQPTRGTFATKCTTLLANDMRPANDFMTGSVTVVVRDVGVTAMTAPTGTIDSSPPIQPQATVYNYGTQAATFNVTFTITGGYSNTQTVTSLAPATGLNVTFAGWQPTRGTFATKCTTLLANDMRPANDFMTGSVTVNVHDVGCTKIIAPTGSYVSGTSVTPACSVYNYGTQTEASYTVRLKIATPTPINVTATVTAHAPSTAQYVTFAPWTANPVGGPYAVTCSTELTTDIVPANNKQTGSVTVTAAAVHDVGATAIKAPSDPVDSGAVITPACSLYNYGTVSESYTARMKIGSSYNNTASVSSHANGAYIYVTFPTWTALPRGTAALSCSTELSGDATPANDKTTGSVTVRVVDAEVLGIIGPTDGNVDSGATVTPSATIRNNGTASATLFVRFDIGTWNNTKSITLAAGVSSPLSFDAWTATRRGTFASKCTTSLSGDLVPANDFKTGTVTVRVHDVAAEAIVAPRDTIGPGLITPQATVHNWGTDREDCTVTFLINSTSPYAQTLSFPAGLPGQDTLVNFSAWTATSGDYTAKCSTYLTTDQIPANNVVSTAFAVGNVDVGVTTNLAPTGSNDTSAALTPSAKVKNFGDFASTFKAFFWMDNGLDAVVYNESLTVTTLSPTTETTVTFVEWPKPHAVGSYTSRCSTYLAGDGDHSNDAKGGSFTITAVAAETGWVRKADLPLGPKSKRVKDGGCLAYGPDSTGDYIYAFKGNNRCEFYRYNTASNTWEPKESIPPIGRLGKKKAVKKGAAMTAAADDKLYAAKGNNCLEFWSYDPSYRSYSSYPWTQKTDVPTGAKNVKEGAGMVPVRLNDSLLVYFLKGSGTQEFYRYSPMPNSWETRCNAPLGLSNKTWKNGSCLAYDGANTIYALKGSYNEFFAYDVDSNTWTSLTTLPLIGAGGKKKKVKDGAGLAYHAGHLYAQKGGNTFEFWMYASDSDKWAQYPDVPMGTGKKVKGGGALVYASGPNALYEFKGNNTFDFFKYGFSAISSQFAAYSPNEMGNFQLSTFNLKLAATPNPFTNTTTIAYTLPSSGNISLRLYDVTGKLVTTLVSGYHTAGTSSFIVQRSALSSGIYVMRIETETSTASSKLIVQ